MIDENELEALVADFESDRVERKASASDLGKISKAVCAFANDLPGHKQPGFVFVGINDDGSCADTTIDDDLLTRLSQLRSNGKILPVPRIEIGKCSLNGCDVAVVQVSPATAPPVRFNGRVWIRVGPTTQEAGRDDERVLSERARHANQPFDRRPADGATIADIDVVFFERQYLPLALAPDVLRNNNRTTEERLASLRFLVEEVPTNGAIIVLGTEPRDFVPGAYVQFLRIGGTQLGDPIKDEKELTGPLYQVMRQLDDLIEINVQTSLDITRSSQALPNRDYPPAALQQLIRNALIHRNYETSHAPVRFYWFEDRIEIQNPGGPFGQVTRTNFGTGITDYRNPLVAEAMAHLGYVQRFGYGIPIAKKLLEANGNPPPEFHIEPNHVLVTVRPRQ